MKIDQNRYNELFEVKILKKDKQKEALYQALDIRKFEIELYWKRATYFWTFIAAIFAGYFLVYKDNPNNYSILYMLCCLGFVFSFCWYLVNRGSKFWQNNWERHVDLLEDEITGPLYKTVLVTGNLSFWKLHKEYNYSVSKINQMLSLYVTFIWFFLGTVNLIASFKDFWRNVLSTSAYDGVTSHSAQIETVTLLVGTLIFLFFVLYLGRSNNKVYEKGENNKTNIFLRE